MPTLHSTRDSLLGLHSTNLETTGFFIPCAATYWRAVLLEDEPGEQPAIALKIDN